MKAEHILLLVLAGALGGAGLMKVIQKRPPARAAAVAQVPPVQTVAAPVAAPPVAPEPKTPVTPVAQPVEPAIPPAAQPAPALKPYVHADRAVRPAPRSVHTYSVKPSPFAPQRQTPVVAQVEAPKPLPQAPSASPLPAATVSPARVEPEPAPAPVPEAPAPPPPPPTVTLNSGMLIPVRLTDGLSSERNASGDAFSATLDHELVADGFVIAERGARVEGRVVAASRGALVLELTRLNTSDGQHAAIRTDRFEKHVEPDRRQDAEKIGGGAAIGAAIGAIAGGGKGAAIGAGVGGGAGAGDVLLTRKPATLPTETRISFRLSAPVTLTERR